MQVERQFYGLF